MVKVLTLGCYLAVGVTMVVSQCISSDDNAKTNEIKAHNALSKAQQEFSIAMLKVLNEQSPQENVFFSPHSVFRGVLLAYILSNNNTEKTLKKGMYIPEDQTKLSTVQTYKREVHFQYMREANASNDYTYVTASKMFADKSLEARECMKELLKDELETLDFAADPERARLHINQWVEMLTKKNILNLLKEETVNEDTKMILANAAYFKGLWSSQFLPQNTQKNTLFYFNETGIRMVEMMKQKGTFNTMVSETLKAHVLELPYKGDSISMYVLLPRFEANAVDKLIKLMTMENIKEIVEFDSLYARQVEVHLPKFTVEKSVELKAVLSKMGLGELFSTESDFSALTGHTGNITFGDAIHKAKVEVSEEGTVAAAATAIFTFRSSRPLDPARFIADHPFVFFIFDKISQNVLFMGVYKIPDKKKFSNSLKKF